jgi:hypothetical protein
MYYINSPSGHSLTRGQCLEKVAFHNILSRVDVLGAEAQKGALSDECGAQSVGLKGHKGFQVAQKMWWRHLGAVF